MLVQWIILLSNSVVKIKNNGIIQNEKYLIRRTPSVKKEETGNVMFVMVLLLLPIIVVFMTLLITTIFHHIGIWLGGLFP